MDPQFKLILGPLDEAVFLNVEDGHVYRNNGKSMVCAYSMCWTFANKKRGSFLGFTCRAEPHEEHCHQILTREEFDILVFHWACVLFAIEYPFTASFTSVGRTMYGLWSRQLTRTLPQVCSYIRKSVSSYIEKAKKSEKVGILKCQKIVKQFGWSVFQVIDQLLAEPSPYWADFQISKNIRGNMAFSHLYVGIDGKKYDFGEIEKPLNNSYVSIKPTGESFKSQDRPCDDSDSSEDEFHDPENELDSDCTLDLINPSSSCSLTSGYSHSVNTTPSISGRKRHSSASGSSPGVSKIRRLESRIINPNRYPNFNVEKGGKTCRARVLSRQTPRVKLDPPVLNSTMLPNRSRTLVSSIDKISTIQSQRSLLPRTTYPSSSEDDSEFFDFTCTPDSSLDGNEDLYVNYSIQFHPINSIPSNPTLAVPTAPAVPPTSTNPFNWFCNFYKSVCNAVRQK